MPIIPKTRILESLINGAEFRKLPQATQKAIFDGWKARTYFNPNTLNIYLSSQPYANEVQKTLRLVASDALKDKFPFGIIQLDDGSYKQLRGNKEELSKIYFGLRNRLIDPRFDTSRANPAGLDYGIEPGKMFFGGFGDQYLVYPYLYSKKVAGKGSLGDLYFNPDEVTAYSRNPHKYYEAAMALQARGTTLQNQFNEAIKAGNTEAASDALAQLQALPELNEPWMMTRIEEMVPKEKAKIKYVPAERQEEARRQLGSFVNPTFFTSRFGSPKVLSAMKDGFVDFDNPRMRVFSGDPTKMGNTIVGGYFLRPGIRIAEPGISMGQGWKYLPTYGDWSEVVNGYKKLPGDLSLDFESEKSLFTDQIGKMYNARGYDATIVPVKDFHENSRTVPSLIMVSGEKAPDSLFEYGMYQEFKKNGGKINRFKNPLHK